MMCLLYPQHESWSTLPAIIKHQIIKLVKSGIWRNQFFDKFTATRHIKKRCTIKSNSWNSFIFTLPLYRIYDGIQF